MSAPIDSQRDSGFKTEFRVDSPNKIVEIHLSGRLNEDVNLGALLTQIGTLGVSGSRVIIDVGGISSINSCGVRDWLLFLEKLAHRYLYSFTELSEAFVDQANLMPVMLGKSDTHVASFIAPYFCPGCDKRHIRKINTESLDWGNGTFQPPPYSCEICSKALVFDALPEEYSHFLKRAKMR